MGVLFYLALEREICDEMCKTRKSEGRESPVIGGGERKGVRPFFFFRGGGV